jgi:hypothetical protein
VPVRPGGAPGLTPHEARRLGSLRHAARWLDSAFRLPGTSRRFGVDPLLGLIPGYGDFVAPLFTAVLLWHARALGLPRLVQLRMIANAGIDALVGAVPLAGDLFDFAWKANQRNVALLERYARERRPSFGDRVFLAAIILLLIGLAAVPVIIVAILLTLVSRLLQG